MIVSTILAIALTAQAPTNEQQRQAQLKALAAKIHQESLAKKPKTKAKPPTPEPAPIIQYVEVTQAEPGSILYLWSQHLPKVPVSSYATDLRSLQPLILADDREGVEESQAARRQPCVPNGTPVRVLQFEQATSTLVPICEVRILEGPFKGQSGWVLEYLLRDRVEVSLKKAKRHR